MIPSCCKVGMEEFVVGKKRLKELFINLFAESVPELSLFQRVSE